MSEMYLGVPAPGEFAGDFADIEMLAREHTDHLVAKLDAEQKHYGSVGDVFVPNSFCQRYLDTMAPRYAHAFTPQGSEPLLESFVRRPMRLGMVIAQELVPHPYLRPSIYRSAPYVDISPTGVGEYWSSSVKEFLFTDERIALTGLLAKYGEDFTDNEDDHTRAVAIGGLTLLHIEEGRFAQFCENTIIQFRNALNNADLSELE